MHHPSALLTRLEHVTRDQHAEVDVYWLDLMASGVTREHYRSMLVRLYGFEAPLESALAYTPHLVVADRRERTLSGLIAQDLLALGLSPARITALPQCPDVGPFSDPAEALGWKYVVERPTRLHGAIKRNLVSRVADIANACSYLSAFDGTAAARWYQLGMLLDEVAAHPGAGDRMTECAHAAFATLSEWFRHGASARGTTA